MIRPLTRQDYAAVIRIVNESWRAVYAGYVDPALQDNDVCRARGVRFIKTIAEEGKR